VRPSRVLPLVLLLWPGVAAAQKFTPRASATVGVGVNAVQSDSAAGAGVALPAGPFLTLTPAVELDYDRPQLEQSLTYSFTANLQFNPDFSLSSGNATYANRAAYQAHAYLTPTVDALFGVAVTEAPLNVVAVGLQPGQVDPSTAPPGYTYNLQGAANEALTKQFSENWSGTQSGAFTFGLPINVTPAGQDLFAGTLALAAARAWSYDTGTLTASSTLAHFTAGADFTMTKQPAFDQSVDTLVASWRREWTESFSSQLDAGALVAVTLQNDQKVFKQPTGAATLDFTRPWFALEAAYLHGALLNLYLAQVQIVDEVALRYAMPIGRDRDVTASATAAYERSQAIAPDANLVDAFDLWFADAGAAWVPRAAPNFAFGLRVSVAKQDPVGTPPAGAVVAGFVRETVLATITYGYPSAATAQPAYLSPIYRAAPVTQRDFENADLRARPTQGEPNDQNASPAPAPEAP
jgi:hypothetical protein